MLQLGVLLGKCLYSEALQLGFLLGKCLCSAFRLFEFLQLGVLLGKCLCSEALQLGFLLGKCLYSALRLFELLQLGILLGKCLCSALRLAEALLEGLGLAIEINDAVAVLVKNSIKAGRLGCDCVKPRNAHTGEQS